jgi:hypothetical protein
VEEKITAFEKLLKQKQQTLLDKYKQRSLLNLTPLQRKTMKQLRQNHNIIIKPTDKNLGPAVLDSDACTKLFKSLNTNSYQQLSQEEAALMPYSMGYLKFTRLPSHLDLSLVATTASPLSFPIGWTSA